MTLLSLFQQTSIFILTAVLFVVLIGSYFLGVRLKKRRTNLPEDESDIVIVSNTLLGLLALLLAFSFGMANSRFDQRRKLVNDEANAMRTAILRADVYPDTVRQPLHVEFRNYIEARIRYYEKGVDRDEVEQYFDTANLVGEKIWAIAAGYARNATEVEEAAQVLPAITSMLELASSRLAQHQGKVPDSIYHFLLVLSVCSTFLLGYESKQDIHWLPVIGFMFMLSLTVFSIIDLDRPRSGFINLDHENQRINQVLQLLDRKEMK